MRKLWSRTLNMSIEGFYENSIAVIFDGKFKSTKGREQSGIRPILVISVDLFNNNMDLVVVIQLLQRKRIPLHVYYFNGRNRIKNRKLHQM